MLWRKKLYEEVCQRPFTQMKKAKYTDLRVVVQKQDCKCQDPALEASHLWRTRKKYIWESCVPMQGLCRCSRIKVFEMGRLPWITWVAQCNNQGPCKSEAGGAEPEMMGRWKSLQKASLLTIWFSLVNQILDFWFPKLLKDNRSMV